LADKKRNKGLMNPTLVIRNETDADAGTITEVTIAAFKTLEISNHTEQFVIEALRAAKALTVSLVAEVDGRVIGHIAFSPVTLSDGTRDWYGLGPVSVLPEYQRKGTGKALVQEGLLRLKALKARGCCLVGHPDYSLHSAPDAAALASCSGWHTTSTSAVCGGGEEAAAPLRR
jgi:putative acetyltransferase